MLSKAVSRLKYVQPIVPVILLLFIKMLLFRYFLFGQIAWSQVTADLASVVFVAGLCDLIASDRYKTYVLWTLNLLLSLLLFTSAVYFNYFSTIPTFSAFQAAHQVGGVKDSVAALIEGRHLLFFADVLVMAAVWAGMRVRRKDSPISDEARPSVHRAWRLGVLGAAVVGLVVSQFYIRHAAAIENELAQAEEIGFINYQVSAALNANKPAGEFDSDKLVYLQQEQEHQDQHKPALFGSMAGRNVVVIQLEAFQNFPIHLEVDGQTITPVLNELADNGYYFPRFFQQIGQGNTSDAEFMSNTAIYPTAKVAMSTGYSDREIPSLPKLLKKRGYTSETFHVNDVTFWDRDKMYPALGFDRYFERSDFENDQFNAFGASDEQLYKTAVKRMVELKAQNKPFYMQLVTASSHHPFKVPPEKQSLTLPDDLADTQLGDYLEAVRYADYAVGELIRALKVHGLYDNTMLVIYGDHFGLQPNDNDPQEVSAKLGIKYHERISRFNVPLIIHVPGDPPKRVIRTVGGQVDIMPTIANLLGISLKDEQFVSFGHDLLNVENNLIGMRYYMPTGSFFNNDIMFVPGKSFEDGTAVSLDTYEPVADFSRYRQDYDDVLEWMRLSDAYVESLPRR